MFQEINDLDDDILGKSKKSQPAAQTKKEKNQDLKSEKKNSFSAKSNIDTKKHSATKKSNIDGELNVYFFTPKQLA